MSFTVLLDNYIEASAQIAVRDQLQTAQDELKAGGLHQQVYQARPAVVPPACHGVHLMRAECHKLQAHYPLPTPHRLSIVTIPARPLTMISRFFFILISVGRCGARWIRC